MASNEPGSAGDENFHVRQSARSDRA
jgi:hypothetical protein